MLNVKKSLVRAAAATMLLTLTVPTTMTDAAGKVRKESRQATDARDAAERYLKEHADEFHLSPDLSDLQHVTTIETEAGSYVRYQQTVDGAPVFTRQVTVTVDPGENVLQVVSDYAPYERIEKTKDKLSEDDAEEKALKHIGAKSKGKWAKTTRELGYIIEDGTAIPVYRVVVHTHEPFGAWETYIHAESGKLLKKRDLNRRASGTGSVFLPNPIVTQGSTAGLTDNRDADSAALTSQLKTVNLLGLDGSGYLTGDYVTVESRARAYAPNLQFNYTRSDDRFEDVMAYYHIDSLQRYIQSLGFNTIINRAIQVNNGKYKQDNSYYMPSTKEITFGIGGVDDAEDAGIIAHEYGHAIQDDQVPGFGNSPEGGAMGEGFGDYLGATHEDATSSSEYGKACVGEWDAVSYASGNPPCLRRLDENKVYPQDLVGEVHADGEIWSQGLYDMAEAFGRDVATKIILQSHFALTPNATFRDGARAIKQADVLLYGGAHGSQIDSIWSARGIPTN